MAASIAIYDTIELGKDITGSIDELIELTEKCREKPTNLKLSYILTKLYDLQEQVNKGISKVAGYEVDLT